MIIDNLWAIDLSGIAISPDYEDESDGSYMVFDLGGDNKLVLSCLQNIAVLDHASKRHRVELTPEEWETLKNIYMLGSSEDV